MQEGKGGDTERVEDDGQDLGLGDEAGSGITIIRIEDSEKGAVRGPVGGWDVHSCTYQD